MSAPWEKPTGSTRQSRSRGPESTPIDDSIASSDDLLFDFFDFFDKTIDQVHAYILHRTRLPEVAEEITLDVYFSLLQRRRFFWWRNVAKISTLLPLADKAIAALPKWEEKTIGDAYMKELQKCVPDATEEATQQKLHAVVDAIQGLPIAEQRIAVLRFFLHWTPEETALALQKSVSGIEKEYEGVLHVIIEILRDSDVFLEVSVEKFLQKISCPPLNRETKARLRLAILEKYREEHMSNVRFVAPAIAMALFLGVGITTYSSFMLPPVSAQNTTRQVAAAQVLLLDKELDYRDAVTETQNELTNLAAYYAEKDLARISVDLLPQTLAQEIRLEKNVYTSLRRLGTRALILSSLRAVPKAHAAEENGV